MISSITCKNIALRQLSTQRKHDITHSFPDVCGFIKHTQCVNHREGQAVSKDGRILGVLKVGGCCSQSQPVIKSCGVEGKGLCS